jgi:hypothetical protein
LFAEGQETLGRFKVSRILEWQDIVDDYGKVMVVSWPAEADRFETRWI